MSIIKLILLIAGAAVLYYMWQQQQNGGASGTGGNGDKLPPDAPPKTPSAGELALLPVGPTDQRITPSQVPLETSPDGGGVPDPVPLPTQTPEARMQTQRPRYTMPTHTPVSGRYAVGRYVLIERRQASPLPVNVMQIIAFYNGARIPVKSPLCEPPSGACHCVADGSRYTLSHAHNQNGITRLGLDLGVDRRIDYIYILNRDDDQAEDRIMGCVLTVRRESDGRRSFDYHFATVATHYYVPI